MKSKIQIYITPPRKHTHKIRQKVKLERQKPFSLKWEDSIYIKQQLLSEIEGIL